MTEATTKGTPLVSGIITGRGAAQAWIEKVTFVGSELNTPTYQRAAGVLLVTNMTIKSLVQGPWLMSSKRLKSGNGKCSLSTTWTPHGAPESQKEMDCSRLVPSVGTSNWK